MQHRIINAELGKTIHVFDDAFSMVFRTWVYNFARQSNFKIGWGDTEIPENKANDYFFYAPFNDNDIDNLGIFREIQGTEIEKVIEGNRFQKAVFNCAVPSDVNYVHTHPQSKVLLYYTNIEWRDGWHGETQFYSENRREVQFTSPYTPGRVIVFDGSIPHTIRPQSIIAAKHRFTLALFFE